MKSSVNVVVVGCGIIGRTHAAALQYCAGAGVVGLVDPSLAAAETLAAELEADGRPRPRIFTTLREALDAHRVDLVALCTPSGLHVEQGLEVLAAGKHLVIEKPLDVDLVRARVLEKAAIDSARNGVVVSVISQHRFDRSSTVVLDAIRNRRLGKITSAVASVAWWRSQKYYDSGTWRGTWAMDGGGALMNQGVHTVDLLLQFMGEPVEVSARSAMLGHERIDVEDTVVATVAFAHDGLAVLHATTAAYPGLTARLQLMGTDGSAVIDGDHLEYFHSRDSNGSTGSSSNSPGNHAGQELDRVAPDEFPPGSDPGTFPLAHVRQYHDVFAAISEGRQPKVTVSDAVQALALVRAVYVAATLNRPVLFSDVLAGTHDHVAVRTGPSGIPERLLS